MWWYARFQGRLPVARNRIAIPGKPVLTRKRASLQAEIGLFPRSRNLSKNMHKKKRETIAALPRHIVASLVTRLGHGCRSGSRS
jgi:hypothetical protein